MIVSRIRRKNFLAKGKNELFLFFQSLKGSVCNASQSRQMPSSDITAQNIGLPDEMSSLRYSVKL